MTTAQNAPARQFRVCTYVPVQREEAVDQGHASCSADDDSPAEAGGSDWKLFKPGELEQGEPAQGEPEQGGPEKTDHDVELVSLASVAKETSKMPWKPFLRPFEFSGDKNMGKVLDVSVFAKGQLMLTASQDGHLRFWNLETGQRLGPALKHGDQGSLRSCCVYPSVSTENIWVILSAGNDAETRGTAFRRWEVREVWLREEKHWSTELIKLESFKIPCPKNVDQVDIGHVNFVTDFALPPGSTIVVSCHEKGCLGVWLGSHEFLNMSCFAMCEPPNKKAPRPVTYCAVSTADKQTVRLLTCSGDGLLMYQLESVHQALGRVFLNPSSTNNSVKKQQVRFRPQTLEEGEYVSCSFTSDGLHAVACADRSLQLWKTPLHGQPQRLRVLATASTKIVACAVVEEFGAEFNVVYTSTQDGPVLVNLRGEEIMPLLRESQHKDAKPSAKPALEVIEPCCAYAGGTRVIARGVGEQLCAWDLTGGGLSYIDGAGPNDFGSYLMVRDCCVYSHDGCTRVLSCASNGEVFSRDPVTGTQLHQAKSPCELFAIDVYSSSGTQTQVRPAVPSGGQEAAGAQSGPKAQEETAVVSGNQAAPAVDEKAAATAATLREVESSCIAVAVGGDKNGGRIALWDITERDKQAPKQVAEPESVAEQDPQSVGPETGVERAPPLLGESTTDAALRCLKVYRTRSDGVDSFGAIAGGKNGDVWTWNLSDLSHENLSQRRVVQGDGRDEDDRRDKVHKALVDCIDVYRGTDNNLFYALSGSWDATLKLWDLGKVVEEPEEEDGESVLRTHLLLTLCPPDKQKVRGAAIFDDGQRAVSCGSGKQIFIWDIKDPQSKSEDSSRKPLHCIDAHESTVWGLTMLDKHHACTWSNDKTVKVWDLPILSEGAAREVVQHRRVFDPPPMAVTAAKPSFTLGDFSVVVGTKSERLPDGHVAYLAFVDLSSNLLPYTAMLAARLACNEKKTMNVFCQMLTDTCRLQEPQRPHFLYRRYRHHGNRNILHLLADFTVSPNGAGMITTMLESLPDPIGVGLISRAGAYSSAERMCASSMLGTAVETSADQTIRLLLDDYHDHVSRLRDPTMTNPLPAVRFLTEAEVVLLMERFQMLGVEFMERLEPVETEIISKDMHSNFMEQSKTGWLVESSHSPYQLDSGDKGAWAAHIWNYKKQQLATSTDDTRWGVSVVSEVLPIEATLQSDHLPFSEILVLSVQQATAKNNPKLFESKTLQAIIQFKWDSYGRLIHNTMVFGSFVHTVLFTTVVLGFKWCHKRPEAWLHTIAWCGWGLCAFLTLVLLKRELYELAGKGKTVCVALREQYTSLYNCMDTCIIFLYVACLWIVLEPEDNGYVKRFAAIHSIALFCSWLRIMLWFQGFESLFFTVTIINKNMATLGDFLVLLTIIIFGYSVAFYVLLAPKPIHDESDEASEKSTSEAAYDSVVHGVMLVFAMFNGDFSSHTYEIGNAPVLSFLLFMSFMFVVPVVMMNVLIASMEQSYEMVMTLREAYSYFARAQIILDIERSGSSLKDVLPTKSGRGGQQMVDDASLEQSKLSTLSAIVRVLLAMDTTESIARRYKKPSVDNAINSEKHYLHMLSPRNEKDKEDSNSEWKGLSRLIEAKISSRLQSFEKCLDSREKKIVESINESQKQLIDDVDAVKKMMNTITEMLTKQQQQLHRQTFRDVTRVDLAASREALSDKAEAQLHPEPEPELEPEPEPEPARTGAGAGAGAGFGDV